MLSLSWTIVNVEELLISISGDKCFASCLSLLVDLCVDVSPCFLIAITEIADWLYLASPDDIYIEQNVDWGL